MLQVKNVKKSYTTGEFTQVALNGVDINFRENEFVAILGQSGSGKTTLLNIIGGLDQYDSGDLIINGKSTKNFKDGDWDAYRNNSVGFVFQSYNLITHLSILDNVEMGMTLSGVSADEKKKRAVEVLERVGLKDHLHKKPNQLSGGQMQRVAIARALANDPDIILADEPTGALDTTTSEQIMDLIKEIADDKLVIMVTHNPELAEQYADRIVNFRDGHVLHDSNPYLEAEDSSHYELKKTSMSFLTALKLSGKNIATKKWRTGLTAFAASIGIIGIALILSLSNGFQKQIDAFQSDALAEFPIIVSQQAVNMDEESLSEMRAEGPLTKKDFVKSNEVYLYNPEENSVTHKNNINQEYLDYLNKIDADSVRSIGYTRVVGMNLLRKVDDTVSPVSFSTSSSGTSGSQSSSSTGAGMTSMNGVGLSSYPAPFKKGEESYLEKNYDVLAGAYPKSDTEMVLVVDNKNRIDENSMKNLGFDIENIDSINFDDIVGTELKLIDNDQYYEKTNLGNFVPKNNYAEMYDNAGMTLKISAVVRQKEDVQVAMLGQGIAYSDTLVEQIINREKDSDIVKAQKETDMNVMTMEKFDADGKQNFIAYLGGDASPMMVYIYPKDFDTKDQIVDYLDKYNDGKDNKDKVVYTDLASTVTEMTGGIMNGITLVLVAFASISLIVSLIMVGIITYISVLERTKEIGVLRALGARKKDITRVFNAETLIIGACSGLLGIIIAYALTFPVNQVIENMTSLTNVAQLNPIHALLLVAISIILTLIGGAIPARMAAKKDPVEALRSE
ncbi:MULTISPECIES: ATP-binding cassette domain-containing protein [unclassified Enterococcus]|uniref:ABC transporter ATP-binding protein/permease n=1 Tax=unclassified Enterococcus TaxID=2608891 RepID=UPI001CE0890A|nr:MULTISPECIES: ABC transporter ATP-binding protein/permease [unclassified Enterococcus]MCA5013825.1 ATP-binding cassette domain-containing protein [Enterococcus sp. S23]MCA5017075.1 ATP-binding cassette domain-containing protein [Enterococcus sp. S22(2020)]